MRIRIDPSDAEKLGCPEIMPLVLAAIAIADLDELSERFSFDPEDWPTPIAGEIAFADAGNPDAKPVPPRWQKQAAVWLASRGSGAEVSWEQAGRVQAMKVFYLPDEDSGKGEAPSESSDGSTTGPSGTS